MNDPELVMARFRPDATDYDFTKGVYWHITSTSPDDITMHDVRGKDYYVRRKTIENNIWYEWIKYPGRGKWRKVKEDGCMTKNKEKAKS